jgi:hypothetical protein
MLKVSLDMVKVSVVMVNNKSCVIEYGKSSMAWYSLSGHNKCDSLHGLGKCSPQHSKSVSGYGIYPHDMVKVSMHMIKASLDMVNVCGHNTRIIWHGKCMVKMC